MRPSAARIPASRNPPASALAQYRHIGAEGAVGHVHVACGGGHEAATAALRCVAVKLGQRQGHPAVRLLYQQRAATLGGSLCSKQSSNGRK